MNISMHCLCFQITRGKCQVISLGAGFDTLYWNLTDGAVKPVSFVEVDFAAVTSRKLHHIRRSQTLLQKITSEGILSPLKVQMTTP